MVWNIIGHVQIVADMVQGPNAVVSAVFWGAEPALPAVGLNPLV